MKKISIFSGTILLITFGLLNSNAIANPSHAAVFGVMGSPEFSTGDNPTNGNQIYATVDSAGNVGNTIVCSFGCGRDSFAGNSISGGVFGPTVLMAPEEVGGIWFGPGTTSYDKETKTFTAADPTPVEITITDENSSVTIFGKKVLTFVSGNIFVVNGKLTGVTENWSLGSVATASVTENNASESLFLGNRKTSQEVKELIDDSALLLLISKVQNLTSLLGSWVK